MGDSTAAYKYIMGKCQKRGESFKILDTVSTGINNCSVVGQSVAMSEEKFWNNFLKECQLEPELIIFKIVFNPFYIM